LQIKGINLRDINERKKWPKKSVPITFKRYQYLSELNNDMKSALWVNNILM